MTKIYEFQSSNMGGYNFMVLASSPEEAYKLIRDRIASNKNQFLDDEFVSDRRNYFVTEIELDGPKVLEDWKEDWERFASKRQY